jgi:hypothetical protein
VICLQINAFDDLDPKTESKADYGVPASRKARLAKARVPLSTLDHLGVDVPHVDFNPEDGFEYPGHVRLPDDTRVALHQNVREVSDDDGFGNLGGVTTEDEDDEDDIVWTVVSLADETVTVTVVGDWGRRRDIPFEEFPDEYKPLTVETDRGEEAVYGY